MTPAVTPAFADRSDIHRISPGAQPISQPTQVDRNASPAPRREPAVVLSPLKNRMILVETLDHSRVAVHAAGAVRVALVRLVVGDSVIIERSPFDPSKGRIVAIDRVFPEHRRRVPNPDRIPHTD